MIELMATKRKKKTVEPDSVFFLKLLMFFIIGTVWIQFSSLEPPFNKLPLGLILGLFYAHHEHFQIDRKIELAVLLFATILSYVAPIGAVLYL